MITACHNCQHNGTKSPKCVTCRRVTQDDIRIRSTPHTRSEMVAARPQPPSETVTPLSPDDEDRLRQAMATLFALDPVQLLFVQHMIGGGGQFDFWDTLKAVHDRIGRYRGEQRAMASAMRASIIRKAPLLAAVLAPSLSVRSGRLRRRRGSSCEDVTRAAIEEASANL